MRIVMEIGEGSERGRTVMRIRTWYQTHPRDGVRVRNLSEQVYGCIAEALVSESGVVVEHEGERRCG